MITIKTKFLSLIKKEVGLTRVQKSADKKILLLEFHIFVEFFNYLIKQALYKK